MTHTPVRAWLQVLRGNGRRSVAVSVSLPFRTCPTRYIAHMFGDGSQRTNSGVFPDVYTHADAPRTHASKRAFKRRAAQTRRCSRCAASYKTATGSSIPSRRCHRLPRCYRNSAFRAKTPSRSALHWLLLVRSNGSTRTFCLASFRNPTNRANDGEFRDHLHYRIVALRFHHDMKPLRSRSVTNRSASVSVRRNVSGDFTERIAFRALRGFRRNSPRGQTGRVDPNAHGLQEASPIANEVCCGRSHDNLTASTDHRWFDRHMEACVRASSAPVLKRPIVTVAMLASRRHAANDRKHKNQSRLLSSNAFANQLHLTRLPHIRSTPRCLQTTTSHFGTVTILVPMIDPE